METSEFIDIEKWISCYHQLVYLLIVGSSLFVLWQAAYWLFFRGDK